MFEIDYLNELRRAELKEVLPHLPAGRRILEFGAGTGQQARTLAESGFDVVAIDLVSSNYAKDRIFPITEYDGHRIPLEDNSVDVVFSSNVLEHVENIDEILAELQRVLEPSGFALHIVPTTAWRFWSFASAMATSVLAAIRLPARLASPQNQQNRRQVLKSGIRQMISGFIPRAHGTSMEGISELWTFSSVAWRRKFRRSGLKIDCDRPIGIFYTGSMLFGSRLSVEKRRSLARVLGSATRVYRVSVNRADSSS